MKHEFFIDLTDLSFSLCREFRRSLSLKILQDGSLIVKTPVFTKLNDIKQFICKNKDWILQRKNYIQHTNFKKEYKTGVNFRYLGQSYILEIEQGITDNIVINESKIILFSTRPKNNLHIKKIIENWIKAKAKEVFNERLNQCLGNFIGLEKPDLVTRNMKRRWGSFSSSHKITLNLKLIESPIRCIDYVIIHELCHAYHMDHSQKFKKLLSSKLPNWKALKQELNESLLVP